MGFAGRVIAVCKIGWGRLRGVGWDRGRRHVRRDWQMSEHKCLG